MTIQSCLLRGLASATLLLAISAPSTAQTGVASILYEYPGASGEHLGSAVAEIGDVDSDSRPDYVVGAVGWNNWRGQVRVLSSSRGTVLYTLEGGTAGDRFGHSIAPLGDMNGDCVNDFIVGAPLASGATPGCGRVYVYSGRNGSLLFVRDGIGANDHMGWSVASLGDLDWDGIDEFAGGAIDDDDFGLSSGSVRAWSGATGATMFTLFGTKTNQLFGASLISVGDRNNDVVPEFAVGGPSITGSADSGLVRIFSGFDRALMTTIAGSSAGDNFGISLATIGDVDNDGNTDLSIGAPQVSPMDAGFVEVHVASGGPAFLRVIGNASGDRFGARVSPAGDVNTDGVPDFVVGAPGEDLSGAQDTGSLRFFSGINGALLSARHGVEFGMQLGVAMAGASDVNEDGQPDLVVGSPGNLALTLAPGNALVISTNPLALWATDYIVSASQPSTPTLTLDVGAAYGGMTYRVLGSITGMSPQSNLGNLQLPLAADRYLKHTLASPINALIQGGSGQLDANGRAQVTFTPNAALLGPLYSGLTLYHAFVVFDALGQPLMASNPVPVTLTP